MKTTQSTIKLLEKAHTKSQRMKVEVVIVANNWKIALPFQNKTEAPIYIEMPTSICLEVLVLSRHALPRSKMTAFHSKLIGKSTGLK